MTKNTIAALVLVALGACGVAESDTTTGQDPVSACEQSAAEQCDAIGYNGNSYCVVVFSQECSEQDAAIAWSICEAQPELPHDENCRLLWR